MLALFLFGSSKFFVLSAVKGFCPQRTLRKSTENAKKSFEIRSLNCAFGRGDIAGLRKWHLLFTSLTHNIEGID